VVVKDSGPRVNCTKIPIEFDKLLSKNWQTQSCKQAFVFDDIDTDKLIDTKIFAVVAWIECGTRSLSPPNLTA